MIALKNNNATLGVKEKIPLKGDILVAQAATFYMASFETTSSVLSFALYELTKNPHVQERLREEIREIIGKYGREIPYEAYANEMPYLGMVISKRTVSIRCLPSSSDSVPCRREAPGTSWNRCTITLSLTVCPL